MKTHILKRFFSLFLCLQLLVVQNFVLAQDATTEEVVSGLTVTSNAEGFNKSEGTYSLRKKVDLSNSDILSQITTFAAVGMGADMLPAVRNECINMLPDMYSYAAGSAAYLAGSIIAQLKLAKANKNISDSALQLSGAKSADIENLKALKRSEEERLKATNLKQISLDILLASLVVAEILALLKLDADITAYVLYMISISCSNISAPVCIPTVTATAIGYALVESPVLLPNGLTPECNPGIGKFNKMELLGALGIVGACSGQGGASGFDLIGAGTSVGMSLLSGGSLADALLTLAISGSGSSCMAAIMSSSKKYYKKFAYKILKKNLYRSIYYGAAIGIVTASVIVTAKKQKEINKNIEDLDKMITSYESMKSSNILGEGHSTRQDLQSDYGSYTASSAPDNGSEDERQIFSEVKRMDLKPIKLQVGVNSPTLAKTVGALNSVSSLLADGKFSEAMSEAGDITKNLVKLKKMSDEIKSNINNRLVKSGKKAIDFDGEAKKIASKLSQGSVDAIKQAGGAAPSLSDKEEKSDKDIEEVKTAGGSQGQAEVALTNTAGAAKADNGSLFNESAWGEETMDFGAVKANGEESLDNFVLGQNDIHKDTGKSIFGVLSVRYLKTAYPQFLEKVKNK